MKNRRLAAQMANRPDIQAALGGNSPSLKSRLGSPNRGGGRGGGAKSGGLLKNRLGTGSAGPLRSPGGGGRFRQGRGQSNVRGFGGVRRGRGGAVHGGRGVQGARGIARGGRGVRGVRGGRGATRGRGRGRGKGDKPVSKDKLDEELDKYMSKTKSHLDAELDEYMQHADDE